uniref:NADH dehydrogenase subunit 6 n=1 Tax=Thaumamermis cosgrovei TaxID=382538 RepID=Q1HBE4_THACS|nr:NADH dehydrogenase subunit 6 [Thaumamermis cosgrovei]ABF48137.1 NADH dehydrogenase subunit 6 [Thaumamermis cosgrovei]ABF48149.1 NADH dehydrogenase subunit 6 [Thaumamermis cosgrovei]
MKTLWFYVLIFMTINNPSLVVLSLMALSLNFMWFIKNMYLSLTLYMVSLTYLGGILLLLFYISMLFSNKPYWNIIFLLSLSMLFPCYKWHMLVFSFINANLNCNKFIVMWILLTMLGVLTMINIVLSNLSYTRQVT